MNLIVPQLTQIPVFGLQIEDKKILKYMHHYACNFLVLKDDEHRDTFLQMMVKEFQRNLLVAKAHALRTISTRYWDSTDPSAKDAIRNSTKHVLENYVDESQIVKVE